MQSIVYCLIVVCGILGCSDLMFAQTPTATPQITPTVTTTLTPSSDVITDNATDITSGSATLNGRIYKYAVIGREWYEYGTASGSLNNTAEVQSWDELELYYKVSTDISELSPATTYYYRLAGQDKMNTNYGSEKSFTTLEATATPQATPAPCDEGIILETYEATGVTLDSATLNGLIGGEFSFRGSLGFEYGTSSGSYTNGIDIEGVEAGQKSVRVNGLLAGTTYYYRIYKYRYEIIPDFTPCYSYGNEEVFTTLTCEAKSVSVSPKRLILQRSENSEVTVTLQSDNCVPEGNTVIATVGKAGSRRISISSAREVTDANGQAKFTITAKNKIGSAKVTFNVGSLKKTLIVKVK